MDDQLTENERVAELTAKKYPERIRKPHGKNYTLVLGVKFAAWHVLLFALSVYCNGKIAEGWLTLFFMEVPWFPVDLPWSLLEFLFWQKDVTHWLVQVDKYSHFFGFILYPPVLIHGVIGIIWWGFLPAIYARYQLRKSRT